MKSVGTGGFYMFPAADEGGFVMMIRKIHCVCEVGRTAVPQAVRLVKLSGCSDLFTE